MQRRWVIAGAGVLALVVIVAGTAWWVRGNLDRLVRQTLEQQGSALLGVPVRVQAVHIDLAAGSGELRGLTIGNPRGFQAPHAFKAARVALQVDLASLAGSPVVLRRIEIVAPDVAYEKGERGTNFDVLVAHANRWLGEGGSAAPAPPSPATERRFIVDRFSLRDAQVQVAAPLLAARPVAVTLPDVELRDLGRREGGLTGAQIGQAVTRALQRQLLVSISFERVLRSIGEGLDKAREAVKGLFR